MCQILIIQINYTVRNENKIEYEKIYDYPTNISTYKHEMQHNYCNHQQIIQTKTTIHIMANISPEMNTNIRIHANKQTYIHISFY